jgi:hypothetical protein
VRPPPSEHEVVAAIGRDLGDPATYADVVGQRRNPRKLVRPGRLLMAVLGLVEAHVVEQLGVVVDLDDIAVIARELVHVRV